jgi:putative restriction endonuclease
LFFKVIRIDLASRLGKLAQMQKGKSGIDPDSVIHILISGNPKTLAARKRFAIYREGMTITEYVDEVGRLGLASEDVALADLAWDHNHDYISWGLQSSVKLNAAPNAQPQTKLAAALAKVAGEHAVALQWFQENKGKALAWSQIKDRPDGGTRLVTQAKEVYKPHYGEYALSIRQPLEEPFSDNKVMFRADGSWSFAYFEPIAHQKRPGKPAPNLALLKCMEDGVPVGALVQTKPKPGVEYLVLGLASVAQLREGNFILEGFSDRGNLVAGPHSDASHDRALAIATRSLLHDFDVGQVGDYREGQIIQVVRRRGPANLRKALLAAYQGRCAITGCDALEVLEAAQIAPYRGSRSDHPQNAILLRADLHSLFDLGLIAIDPATQSVMLSASLTTSSYANLRGQKITLPNDSEFAPDAEALARHLKWTGIK